MSQRDVQLNPNQLKKTTFGEVLDMDVPEGCNTMVLCAWGSGGIIPLHVMIPHQLYLREIDELIQNAKRGNSFVRDDTFAVIYYKHEDVRFVSLKDIELPHTKPYQLEVLE